MVNFLARSVTESIAYILPVKRETKEAQTLIVRGSAKDVRKDSSLTTSSLHSSQTLQRSTLVGWFEVVVGLQITYRDGDRVQPDKDIGREDFIESHATESIPEVSQWL